MEIRTEFMLNYVLMKKAGNKKRIQITFWKRFLRLTRGRIPVLQAIKTIMNEENNPSFKKTLSSVRESIEKGSSLSEILVKYPPFFSPFVVELIKSAEKTGSWDEILQEIIDGLEDGIF